MKPRFTSDFFAANRHKLRESVKADALIVVTANGLLQRGGDSAYPFHQDASFWYLTGIDEADVVLVIDGDKEYLIVPELSDYQNIFDGKIDAQDLMRQSGIKSILGATAGWERLAKRLKASREVAVLTPSAAYVEVYGMYTNPARQQLMTKIQEINPEIEAVDIRLQLARLRMVKQPIELTVMQRAIDLTIEALEDVKRQLPKLGHEYEIEAAITGHILSRGAIDAWKPTVASGKKACTLHSHTNNASLVAEELVVIDVGAEVDHYVADITRTWSIGGKPSKRQAAVHKAVQEVQDFALGLQAPGVLMRENEKKIESFMGAKLRELGLIKEVTKEAVRKYYPHACSHFLGIDPHDAGDYDAPLEPGVVLTVEPGIYIPEEGIGVRIEDDVLITDRGVEILSAALPRTLV